MMETVWPSMLINAAVVILLWGLVWRSQHQRMDTIQRCLDNRVGRDYCALQHRGIHEDIQEIKQCQEGMAKTLEEIRVSLARENGRRQAMEERT